jgi:hypothetical protein
MVVYMMVLYIDGEEGASWRHDGLPDGLVDGYGEEGAGQTHDGLPDGLVDVYGEEGVG